MIFLINMGGCYGSKMSSSAFVGREASNFAAVVRKSGGSFLYECQRLLLIYFEYGYRKSSY